MIRDKIAKAKKSVDWKTVLKRILFSVVIGLITGIIAVATLVVALLFLGGQMQYCNAAAGCMPTATGIDMGAGFSILITIAFGIFVGGIAAGITSKRSYRYASASGFLLGFIPIFLISLNDGIGPISELINMGGLWLACGAIGVIGGLYGCALSNLFAWVKERQK